MIQTTWFPIRDEDIKFFRGLDKGDIADVFMALLAYRNGVNCADDLSTVGRIVYEIISEHIEQDLADME